MFVASPEDTVLAKLEWSLLGSFDRQLADAVAVLAVAAGRIDDAYLDEWAGELGVVELLQEARRKAGARD